MKERRLGREGEPVSVIGFGGWPIGGGMGNMEEREAVKTVHAAIDHGITLIDTAQAYKRSEEFLGRALAGGRRNRVFLATKVSFDYSPAGIRSAIEASLRDLGTDSVDLYQIHSWNEGYPVEDSIGEMERLRKEGKIRFIGVSNYSVEQLGRASGAGRIDSSQPCYNLFDREIEDGEIDYCTREGVGILAHSVFAKGLLTGKYRPDHIFPADDERSGMPRFQGDAFRSYLARADRLKTIAAEIGLGMVQLSIAWVLRNPGVTCALAGAKSVAQIEEQAAAADAVLSAEVLQEIDQVLA